MALGDFDNTTIDLEITSVCNAVCPFCPREIMPDKSTFMPIEAIERLARQFRSDEKYAPRVTLCGIGEPTLHPRLETITELLTGAGAYVSMTTNGSVMNVDLFRRLVDKGMKCFNYSLNALTAETHQKVMRLKDFDRIVDSLIEVVAYQVNHHPDVRMHVTFVVCSANEHEAEPFVAKWKGLGVSQIWLHPVNNRAGLLHQDIKSTNLESLERVHRDDPMVSVDIFKHHSEEGNICKIARSLNFISADGEARLCAMDYRRQTSYGNVGSGNLREMYQAKLRSYVAGSTLDLCDGCDFRPLQQEQETPRVAGKWHQSTR